MRYLETVLQVKKHNQHYQSTEGETQKNIRKSEQHKMQQNNKDIHIQNTQNPLVYNNTMG